MNAPARFLVHDVEDQTDPKVCRNEADVREVIANLDGLTFQVLSINVDEFCRDVTADFLPDEPEEEREEDETTVRDHAVRMREQSGAFR